MSPVKIFVIEDNLDILDYISRSLSQYGCRVKAFSNGTDGLAYYDQFKPDIVITDIHMPGISGNQVAAIIRNTKPYCPRLICITGDPQEAVKENFDLILQKPVSLKDILTIIPS